MKVYIDHDANTGVYYLSFERQGDREPPLPLGQVIEPDDVFNLIEGYLIENRITYSHGFVKSKIAYLLRNAIRDSGVEDWKTFDVKIVKWLRKRRK